MEKKKHECCTPEGQISRYVDCVGCDKKPIKIMENKKQSSVEWLIDQIDFDANTRWFSQPEWFAIYQKAKAMHKEEIEEAHYDGSIITLLKPDDDMLKQSEQYYKETFGDEEVL